MKIKNIKSRYKLGAIFVMALLFLCVFEVASVDRTITDTSDTFGTYIVDSDGTYYNPTGSNLETAITAINNTRGVITLPTGYFDVSNDITLRRMTIVGQGSGEVDTAGFTQINLTGNNTITIGGGGSLRNLRVKCPSTHGTIAVHVVGDDAWSEDFWGQNNVLDDVYIKKTQNENGTALNISSYPSANTENCGVALNTFNDIQTQGFKYGIYLWSKDSASYDGYTNGNIFNGVTMTNIKYGIVLDRVSGSSGDCAGNTFDGVQIDPTGDSIDAIVIKNGYKNSFTNLMIWDWGSYGYMLNLSSSSSYNYFHLLNCDEDWVIDSGTNNRISYNRYESLYDGKIWNSNGKYWEVDGTADDVQIQAANDDLGSGGGTIYLPGNITFTISDTITIGDNIWLTGGGNSTVLSLDNTVDKNMIENSGWASTGNTGIRISDLVLDGNGESQTFETSEQHPHLRDHIISFKNVDNSIIENCFITKGKCANIYWWNGNNNIITNCEVSYAGIDLEGTNSVDWYPSGIFTENHQNLTISNCIVHDNYADGIIIESHYASPEVVVASNWVIDSCICYNNLAGIWAEKAKNGIISNCVTHHNTKDEAYNTFACCGIAVGQQANNISITGCVSYGNYDGAKGNGYVATSTSVEGSYVTFSNCITHDNNNGFSISMQDVTITGCSSYNEISKGIYLQDYNFIITNNRFENEGGQGIYVTLGSPTNNEQSIISNNIFKTTGDNAIQCSTNNVVITDNTISDVTGIGIEVRYYGYVINDNWIYDCSSDGITIHGVGGDADRAHNGTVNGNFIDSCSDGIELDDCQDFSVVGNRIVGCTNAIRETGTCGYNLVGSNQCKYNTAGITTSGTSVETDNME